MGFWKTIRGTDRSHWKDAGILLLFNLIGSLAPVWLGFLLLKTLSHHPSWSDFSQHGEFALYSAAMFAPALYVITRDLAVPGFAGRQIFSLICLVGMLVATVFFAPVATAFLAPDGILIVDQDFVRTGTLLLFALSVLVMFVVTVLDNARLVPDPRHTEAEQQRRLSEEFDRLGDETR